MRADSVNQSIIIIRSKRKCLDDYIVPPQQDNTDVISFKTVSSNVMYHTHALALYL